jgi:hypothetical protein
VRFKDAIRQGPHPQVSFWGAVQRHLAPYRHTCALEHHLHCELHQPRVICLTRNPAKASRRGIEVVTRIAELRPVEQVVELGAELRADLLIRAEARVLEEREVPVCDAIRAQRRIDARLVAKGIRCRLGKALELIQPLPPFRPEMTRCCAEPDVALAHPCTTLGRSPAPNSELYWFNAAFTATGKPAWSCVIPSAPQPEMNFSVVCP